MSKTVIPTGYAPALSERDTQAAIDFVKRTFSEALCKALTLSRVSAPLFVDPATGLNDDLNGVERPVAFDIAATGKEAQIVHSLAKWKRQALYRYGFAKGTGLYTDMNAIRRDEIPDNLHSVYVDQWDWEKILPDGCRNEAYLKETVTAIVQAICKTAEAVNRTFAPVACPLSSTVSFITTQELEDQYPALSPKQREDAFLKIHKTAFIMQIGGKLRSGQKHDGRAPDYDDWSLNGDIVFWNDLLNCAFEVSSMGIRVDAASLAAQLKEAGCEDRAGLPFHKAIADGTLPLTIGGGIGQSRLCMLLLQKAHIGEVQVSLWDEETRQACQAAGVSLL